MGTQDDGDVLGKADALLRRHVPAPAGSGGGTEVPVLTELITPGGKSHAPAVPEDAPVASPQDQDAAPRDDQFKRDLVAEVVSAVEARLTQDLERRLTQQVMTEVHASVAATLGDLRQDIANAVGDAVAEALARRPHG